jgi:kynurenine formamidase
MCDDCIKTNSWRGWNVPAAGKRSSSGQGAWHDLSHPISPKLPSMAVFPAPTVERVMSLPKDPANITRFQMIVHQGTHVDAPCHLFANGPTIDQIPIERFIGDAVIWRIEKPAYGLIDVADLDAAHPKVSPGDIVLFDTGWAPKAGTTAYNEHPSLSVEAAAWLVKQGVKMIGVDFGTPDLSANRRPPGFTWPVHLVLLGNGVLIAEHLTNLRPLANQRVELLMLPINIEGADGAPARVLARPAAAA